jgi:hypothetical protein
LASPGIRRYLETGVHRRHRRRVTIGGAARI